MQRLYSELIFYEFYSSYQISQATTINVKDLSHQYFVMGNQLYLFLITGIIVLPLSKDSQRVIIQPGRIEPLLPAQLRNLATNRSLSVRSRKQLTNFVERLETRLETISREKLTEISKQMESFSLTGELSDIRNLGIYFWQYIDYDDSEEYNFWD